MKEVLFALPGIALTILCWGAYGSVLHKGQGYLGGDKLKPLICVGAAYFIVAIIIPVVFLAISGKLGGDWSFPGVTWSMAAGVAGTFGALGIILALTSGGNPIYVMPLVFGGAPVVNVFVTAYLYKIPMKDASPLFYAGMIMVAVGAVCVLVFKPSLPKKHAAAQAASQVAPSSIEEKEDESHVSEADSQVSSSEATSSDEDSSS